MSRVGRGFPTSTQRFRIPHSSLAGANLQRTTADSVTAADVATRQFTGFRFTVDVLGFTDEAPTFASVIRFAADSLGLADVVNRVVGMVRTTSDEIDVAEDPSETGDDRPQRTVVLNRSTTETLTIFDLASIFGGQLATAAASMVTHFGTSLTNLARGAEARLTRHHDASITDGAEHEAHASMDEE